MNAGIGTHIDAPAHIQPGGLTVEEITLEELACSCVCINISKQIKPDLLLSVDHILAFEEQNRMIQPGEFVIVHTGWDQYWSHPEQYHNQHQFPSVSESAALLLLKRNISGLGIDTLSPDCPQSGFPVHKHLLKAGKYIIENVANAKQLTPTNNFIITAPLKAKGLTEAPVRLFALQPKA